MSHGCTSKASAAEGGLFGTTAPRDFRESSLHGAGFSANQNNFPEALQALPGKDIEGFSATTILRLKSVWEEEYDEWLKLSFNDKRYVHIWADGIYSNI